MLKIRTTDNRWGEDSERFISAVHSCLGNVKLLYGSLNNCIYIFMGNAIDHLKQAGIPHHMVRFLTKVQKEWNAYERNLKFSDIRYFDLATLPDETRKSIAADVTNEDYFDFWTAQGAKPYLLTKDLFSCMSNKYRLVLERHGVKQADKKADMMSVLFLLNTQLEVHKHVIHKTSQTLGAYRPDIAILLSAFNLQRVRDAWWKAMREFIPQLRSIDLDEIEEKNIGQTQLQIFEIFMSDDFLYGGIQDATESFSEFFATKGYRKKALQEIATARNFFDSI